MHLLTKIVANALRQQKLKAPHYRLLRKLSPAKLEVPEGKAKGVVLSFDVETWADQCGGKHEETANWREEYESFIPNLLEVLDRFDIKAQFFLCGRVVELYRDLLLPLVQEEHGLGAHGYSHEIMPLMQSGAQTAIIHKVKTIIMKFFNIEPVSWRCPGGAANVQTYYALIQNGFKISSSAIGIGGPIDIEGVVEIPIVAKMDGDILGYHSPGRFSLEHWNSYLKKTFNRTSRGIMVFGMHTWVQRKYDPKLRVLETFLSHIHAFKRETWLGKLDDLL